MFKVRFMLTVLRLGHRLKRDERISTHCGLVSRALGADKIIYSGEKDEKMIKNIRNVVKKWGGPFSVVYGKNYRKIIKHHKKKNFLIIHLTMYGLPLMKKIKILKKKRNLLIIIGSEKVPKDVYGLSDLNISVTSQPHSEVAALAVVLEKISREKTFKKAKVKIIPQERGKKVVEK